MKTIYDQRYQKLIKRIKDQRLASGINQQQAGALMQKSRHWIAKIEMCELRLDVLHFVKLCRAYHLKASDLIKSMEEESSENDGSFLGILKVLFCSFCHSCFARFVKYPDAEGRQSEKCLAQLYPDNILSINALQKRH